MPGGGGMPGDGMYQDGGGPGMASGDPGASGPGGEMPIPGGAPMSPPSGGGGVDGGMGGAGAMRLTADPADGRYVDNNYTPLRAERVREAMKNRNPADAFLVVAKRMPIRLRLLVDQRKLHRLLAECGNSLLPVEIRQVRLNRGKSSGGGGGGYDMGGGPGYDMGGGPGYDPSGAPGMGGGFGEGMGASTYDGGMGDNYSTDGGTAYPSGSGGMGSFSPLENLEGRSQISSTTSHDVPVELYGIIYIYNPVDKELQDRLKERTQGDGLTGPVQPDTGAPG